MTPSRLTSFANDGLSFQVTDSGPLDGAPLVLLHGFPQTSKEWRALSPLLHARGFRTFAPDLRGYSRGARPEGRSAYRSSKLVSDVTALIAAIDQGPVHLIGHDWGALLAWCVAAARPDLLRTLTCVSVFHYAAFLLSTLTSNQLLRSYYIGLFQLPWLPEFLIRRNLHLLMRRAGMDEAAIADVERDIIEGGALTYALNWYRGILFSNQFAMTRKVSVPTTFVWGDRDAALGPKGAELTSQFVTGPYRLVVLTGAGHWIPEQSSQALADAFFAGLATGAARDSR